ncbi:GNAT family N-acetyltransferase [Micromonospora echinofusca]|uniref:Lysine N-acyltransferase MbtK n=1 Tax=Micromonospora echinofusca TaxID=47858 RepID=A0ABS3VT37_MICEH|nr:GNAT family N-acetyltransferase [Micromonospora echinofusca]
MTRAGESGSTGGPDDVPATGIHRDRWGVPHLWADTVDDLARLQGRAAALDRAWQIEVERWRSEGRLAAHVGPGERGWDRFARRARLDDTARRCFDRLAPETRRWVTAYVDGVNDGLAEGAAGAPEFAAAGCAPGRWRPWSPLGVFLIQHILFATFPQKLWHAHVAATLGPDARDLFAVEGPSGSGSNAWVLPGDPATGRAPIVAGDPHRILELPGIYQQVRLACPEFDVLGFAFPGVPGLPHFGHAGDVAWAVTNAMADYQDLYREQVRRDGDRILVRDGDGWVPARHHVEHIEVRGGDPEPVEVVETPRGPVVDHDRHTGEALSLRIPSRVEERLGFDALLPLLRARTAEDVTGALRSWVEPVNSVLVADRTGTVRHLVAGLVPVRDERCRREPVPGWDPRYAWRGAYLPMTVTPVDGIAVCANDRRADVAHVGVDFAPPHRARRIRDLLDAGVPAHAVHVDTRLAAPTLRDLLARVDADALSAPAAVLRQRLTGWDGRMAADSTDAGAFAAWRAALVRRLHDHPVLRPLRAAGRYDDLFAPWTDPLARIGHALDGVVAGLHRLGGDVVPAAVAALEDVAADGPPVAWGRRHLLHPVHLGVAPTVDAAVAAMREVVALSGDTDCVLSTASVPGVSDACWRGPVARYVWDLTDRAASRWVVPFGASGRPDDPHFADQLPRWAGGDLIPVVTDWRQLTPPRDEEPMVYQETIPGFGELSLVVVDPAAHAGLLHGWVTEPRAAFWGMGSHTIDEVRGIYEFIDRLATHHAYLVLLDGQPIGLFQTYQPEADPVGERYRVQPGDVGMHLLLAPGRRPPRGLTTVVGPALARFLFRDATRTRIVVEPDVRNHHALRRLEREGFTFAAEIDMPDKRAQLAFLTRARFESDHPVPGQVPDAALPRLPDGRPRTTTGNTGQLAR